MGFIKALLNNGNWGVWGCEDKGGKEEYLCWLEKHELFSYLLSSSRHRPFSVLIMAYVLEKQNLFRARGACWAAVDLRVIRWLNVIYQLGYFSISDVWCSEEHLSRVIQTS